MEGRDRNSGISLRFHKESIQCEDSRRQNVTFVLRIL